MNKLLPSILLTSCMAPNQTTQVITISNGSPNTNAVLPLLRGDLQPRPTTAAGVNTIYARSDWLPVSILEIFPLNTKSWQKTPSSDRLASALCTHLESLNVSSLLNVVTMQMPLDIATAYVDAENIKKAILGIILDVYNLFWISFLNSTGENIETLLTTTNTDHARGLLYIRLSCTINANKPDKRVEQEALWVSLCLKLLPLSFDPHLGLSPLLTLL